MEENISKDISFDRLAKNSGISPRHFKRRFKSATGEPPKLYLQRLRKLHKTASLAVQASKNVLTFGIGKTINEGLDYVASISANIIPSDDLFEAFKAVGEKRNPDFLKK